MTPGQIWQDCDKRGYGRKLRVIAVGQTHASVQEVVTGPTTRKPRQTRIRLDRFRPTSTGYRLLSEGSSSDA